MLDFDRRWGLLSSRTMIPLPFGVHLIWVGFVVMALFLIARTLQ